MIIICTIFLACNNEINSNPTTEDFPDTLLTGHLIKVIEPEFHFGYVNSNELDITHVFTITNVGYDTLNIFDLSSSCGCTFVNSFDSLILPQDSTQLPVIFRTAGFEGNFISKMIYVSTNDTMLPTIILNVQAEIDSSFNQFEFEIVNVDQRKINQVKVKINKEFEE